MGQNLALNIAFFFLNAFQKKYIFKAFKMKNKQNLDGAVLKVVSRGPPTVRTQGAKSGGFASHHCFVVVFFLEN